MAGLAKKRQRGKRESVQIGQAQEVDISEIGYRDLQEMAKAKGLKYVGISRADLLVSLEA